MNKLALLFIFLLFPLIVYSQFTVYADTKEEKKTSLRPYVTVTLLDGTQVEGQLERFSNGKYVLLSDNTKHKVLETDIKNLQFEMRGEFATQADPKMHQLIHRFYHPNAKEVGERVKVDVRLISEIAAFGKKAIAPILAGFKENDEDYQAVGEILKQMGPTVYPILVESVRDDAGRFARFPVWWALVKGGAEHAKFIEGMLSDQDPRIRVLAMDVLYSWSITSETIIPKWMDDSLIKILDDPSYDVKHQAPLILGRIGFNSEKILPALIQTFTNDKYANIRSSSVAAIGYLATDLKADDPDLIQIVKVLSKATTEDPDETVRSYAAKYLGNIGPKAANSIEALKQATDDKKEYVRKSAEEALRKIGTVSEVR